jgi:hypothetical protein
VIVNMTKHIYDYIYDYMTNVINWIYLIKLKKIKTHINVVKFVLEA